jgi:hypothetical protein
MKTTLRIHSLQQWEAPSEWPTDPNFYVIIIADALPLDRAGYDSLVRTAVLAGARSLFFWGSHAHRAADSAVFQIAEYETLENRRMSPHESFITVPFSDDSSQDVVDLLLDTYLPDATDPSEDACLVVCGLQGSHSMAEFQHSISGRLAQ